MSAATVWELTIKSMLGKLTIPDHLPALLDEQGFTHLAVTADDAWALRGLPELARHDPFDRLRLAQSRRLDLPLITADRMLLAMAHPGLVDARI